MTNKVSAFPAHNDPSPLHRYGGRIDANSELPISYIGDDYAVAGNGTVRGLPTMPTGTRVTLFIEASPTFVNSAKLQCPKGVDWRPSPGDVAEARASVDGSWTLLPLRGPLQTANLREFGVKGDGVTNDYAALNKAGLDAVSRGIKLTGNPGDVYRLESEWVIPSGLKIDLCGGTLKPVSSSTSAKGVSFGSSVTTNSTTPASNAAKGAKSVVVTSATGFTVGKLMFFDIWSSTPALVNYFHVAKITAVSGTTISFDLPLPFAFVTGAIAGTSAVNTVAAYTPIAGVEISNARFDLSAVTGDLSHGIDFKYFDGCVFENMEVFNLAAVDGVGTNFYAGYKSTISQIRSTKNGGIDGTADQAVGMYFQGLSDCDVYDVKATSESVFGIIPFKCSSSRFNMISSIADAGRCIKVTGCLDSTFSGIHANNCNITGATNLGITDGTADCTFIGVHTRGASFSGSGIGIWFSDQYNRNNTFVGWSSRDNFLYDISIGATDTGNIFVGGRTDDPATKINNVGNARFIGVNDWGAYGPLYVSGDATFGIATPLGADQRVTSRATGTTNQSCYLGLNSSSAVTSVIRANGNFESATNTYGALSDERSKRDITDARPMLDDFRKLTFRNFVMKDDQHETKQLGVISQEAEAVFPGLIYEAPFFDEEGTEISYKHFKYSVLNLIAAKALQELDIEMQAHIAGLEARIRVLESGVSP